MQVHFYVGYCPRRDFEPPHDTGSPRRTRFQIGPSTTRGGMDRALGNVTENSSVLRGRHSDKVGVTDRGCYPAG